MAVINKYVEKNINVDSLKDILNKRNKNIWKNSLISR